MLPNSEITLCNTGSGIIAFPDGDDQTIFGLDVILDYRSQEIATQLMNYMVEVSRAACRKGVSKLDYATVDNPFAGRVI